MDFSGNKNFVQTNLTFDKNSKIFDEWKLKFRICTASDPFFQIRTYKKRFFYSNRLKYELKYIYHLKKNGWQ